MTTPADFMRAYEQACNTHVFDNVVSLIAPDAVYWFNDGSFHGPDEIRGAFEKTWTVIQGEQYALEDVHWIAAGDAVAVCLYRFRWQGHAGGQFVSGEGRGTSVLRREDGHWRVAHEHLSRIPA